jgi:hypothetical protein
MRFSIRDLLWVTVVVAMGLGWWVSYMRIDGRRIAAVQQTQRHRNTLGTAKHWVETLSTSYSNQAGFPSTYVMLNLNSPLNWAVLDEPLVEP